MNLRLLLLPSLLLLFCLSSPALAQSEDSPPSGNGRLLTTDAATVIAHPVIGLQRSALPLVGGLVLDTSLIADVMLAPNLGLRWAMEAGPHRFVAGARYTHFVGASVYSSAVTGREPALDSFEPTLSGPTVYGAYGLALGPLTVQGEARYAHYESDYLAVTGAAAFHLTQTLQLIAEAGVRLKGGSKLRAAAGVRYGGEHLGVALGAAYVDIDEPAFPGGGLAVAPVLDLSWTFR
ncbi:hypothetical protein [Hyalangium minutum]|uniref:Outer membrane protein beta-barrel domain-containing protein n=1 Tax=Hyalangium minutum TaxID=394096 RepID=A0A085VZM3_9BACT|nr:hypothetical protein [Hyalangium minutum]KFE60886.1 hypothetical protein DB31_4799 [Hyalangium minutum]